MEGSPKIKDKNENKAENCYEGKGERWKNKKIKLM